jgi:PAS domain S-box-containing protein
MTAADLFSFSFDKPVSTLLALIPALINMGVVIYVLLRMPAKAYIRVFALFTVALMLWQLDDVASRLVTSEKVFDEWNSIFSVGWIFFAPLGLFFALQYAGHTRLASNPLVWMLIFLPAVIFHAIYGIELFPHYYVYSPFWGWAEPHDTFLIDKLMVLWIVLNVLLMLIILTRTALERRLQPIVRYQALLIAGGIAIPFLQGVTTQAIMPIFLHLKPIPVTSAFMSFFAISTLIGLERYKLFNLAEVINTGVLLDNLTDIVFTISRSGNITYVNEYGLKVLGYSEKEAEGLTFKILFADDLRQYTSFEKDVLNPSLDGDPVDNVYLTLKNRKGEPIFLNFSADPVVQSGIVHGALIVAHDITRIRQAETSIRKKNTELERYNAELEQFAFVASHDMKEPLRMVSNYTQLLAQRYYDKLDKDAREYIDYAVDGVHRMQELINDLLDYSRIGRTTVTRTEVDCNKLMEEIIRNLQGVIIETHTNIEYTPLPTLQASKSQVLQLIQNLIENAIKFRREGINPKITITAEKQEDKWLFKIADNGIGINPEYTEKVFTLFQRLHDRQHYPGTGIGLAICKKIVELYEGSIWFEPTEGGGTTFCFTLKG